MPPSKREELVETAMKVFAREGYHGTGVERVLQESGVSRMTLYNHFKSKEELILAALRRRDEVFRNRLMKFVAGRGGPIEQILAVFDFYAHWFEDADFCGCMFINASAEFRDSASPISRAIVEHRARLVQYLQQFCEQAGVDDPASLAAQLGLLLDGAVVTAQGSCCESSARGKVIQRARQAAIALINASQPAPSRGA